MTRHLILLSLALLIGLAASATAQVTVNLRFHKRNFLAGEPVPLTVSLTNMSGRDLSFRGTNTSSWIDFIVSSNRGVPLTPVGTPAFGTILIPAGKTLARTVDLAQLYSLRELGNFSVYSIVRLPGQKTGGYQSQRHLFTLSGAKPYWSQVVGVPGKPGLTREFRLIHFSGDRKTQLYVQVADTTSGLPLRTHHLGEVLMFRKPTVLLDSKLNMHVLYLITPAIWGHAEISPDGKFLGRKLFKNAPSGNPSLVNLEDGSVLTVGGIPYDPEKAAAERAKARKASDRPAFIYE